jgi:flagellar protein FlaG
MATIDLIHTPRPLTTDEVSKVREGKKHVDLGAVTTPSSKAEERSLETATVKEPSKAELDDVLDKLKEHAQRSRQSLEFERDDTLGRMVIKVVDSHTKEVVRQIPSEEVLEIAKRLRKSDGASGVVFEAEV